MHSATSILRATARMSLQSRNQLLRSKLAATARRSYHTTRLSLSSARQRPVVSQLRFPTRSIRHKSSAPAAPTAQGKTSASLEPPQEPPAYQMTFTCKRCSTRSSHRVSKQGYYHGTVLITCPGCKSRHLISDHLKIFSNERITLDDIMREKGRLIKRGTLDTEGDVEFWTDSVAGETQSETSADTSSPSTAEAPNKGQP